MDLSEMGSSLLEEPLFVRFKEKRECQVKYQAHLPKGRFDTQAKWIALLMQEGWGS